MGKWIFLICFYSIPLGTYLPHTFIVWNVGQGSWSTWIWKNQCFHFDMGGEYFPKKAKKLCQNVDNFLFLSHDDSDHFNFISKARGWKNFCLFRAPRQIFHPRKKLLIRSLPLCPPVSEIQELEFSPQSNRSNDLSRIYWVPRFGFLIPGDSTRKQEKIWSLQIPPQKIHWWLLGHHGSLTSNSKDLIARMRKIRGAIASARFRRYGHPHYKVVAQMKASRIPLLKTEDWGNIWILIK